MQIGSGDGVDAQNVAVQAGSSISANGVSGPGRYGSDQRWQRQQCDGGRSGERNESER